jgi:hypothetical protein
MAKLIKLKFFDSFSLLKESFLVLFLFQATKILLILFWNYSYLQYINIEFIAASLRFDLMIVGYIALPSLILLSFNQKFKLQWLSKLSSLWIYFSVFLFCLISFSEFIFIKIFSNRWNSFDLNPIIESYPDYIHEYTNLLKELQALPIVLFGAGLTLISILITLRINKTIQKTNPKMISHKKNLISLILYILCIRSSLGSYHLDLRHSEVSKDTTINSLTVNTLYLLDQTLRQRR